MASDSIAHRMGGPVVKDYVTHFLRDDTEIRRSAGCFEGQIEGYSLFSADPVRRVAVFGGSLEWAISMADDAVRMEYGDSP